MYSIGQLSKHSGLSRSTLLYYDRMGILKPSARSDSNYRLYSEVDVLQLNQIIAYRQTGISLQQIKRLLTSRSNESAEILQQRLQQLNHEIEQLHQQQAVIVQLLENESLQNKSGKFNKQTWTDVLRSTGMNDKQMWQWHHQFETHMPQAHQKFLESLGVNKHDIKAIRARSKTYSNH